VRRPGTALNLRAETEIGWPRQTSTSTSIFDFDFAVDFDFDFAVDFDFDFAVDFAPLRPAPPTRSASRNANGGA
jgi:hypothetical protein